MKKFNEIIELIDTEFEENVFPNAMMIYRKSSEYFQLGKAEIAEKLVKLNFLLHNSVIPASATIGKGSRFAYSGIGVVIHKNAKIGQRCLIGQGVTVGGKCKSIGNDVYLATGSKIIGNCAIGHASIIGANCVVTGNIDELSIVVGNPGKVIKKISRENIRRYQGYFFCKNSEDKLEKFINLYKLL